MDAPSNNHGLCQRSYTDRILDTHMVYMSSAAHFPAKPDRPRRRPTSRPKRRCAIARFAFVNVTMLVAGVEKWKAFPGIPATMNCEKMSSGVREMVGMRLTLDASRASSHRRLKLSICLMLLSFRACSNGIVPSESSSVIITTCNEEVRTRGS